MTPIQEVLFGNRLADNKPSVPTDAVVSVGDFGINETQLSKNILCIGGTGSGKTNAINIIVNQLRNRMSENDVMLIFDTKGDFVERFYNKERGDFILGSSTKFRDRSAKWNVYLDVLADGFSEEPVSINIDEVARSLFERNQSQQQPFFPNAARGVFSAYMLSMVRAARTESYNDKLNNKEIREFFTKAVWNDYQSIIDSAPDMRYLQLYLGNFDNPQALGVLAEILVMLKDTFIGVFGEAGDFSIRKFIREKGGRTLFLEYDLSVGQVISPLYSVLVDLALKEALSASSNNGVVYIILDELKLLPKLQHLDDAVNFGRSMGVRVLAGLQSVTQLYHLYGENKGKAIAAGFCSMLAFRPNDAITREYVMNYFGRNFVNEILVNQDVSAQRREGHTVEDWDLNGLKLSQAVVGMDGCPPFIFYFSLFG
jgi:type IV secretory pathway TraG/TraD family ATPase VirD4